jgi:predicted GNAT family acetyltransferase
MTDISILSGITGASAGEPRSADPEPAPLPALLPASSDDAPPTQREREALSMASVLDGGDPALVPLAELRILANATFRSLDSDAPPRWALERYGAVVDEIERRMRRIATQRGAPARGVFRDSPVGSRFELYFDGCLVAYLRYSIRAGRLTLRAVVENPGFEGKGLGRVLIRGAMLDAHRRRIDVITECVPAQEFLQRNPQYLALARSPRRRDGPRR